MNVKIKKVRSDSRIPVRASDGAVGYDVFASVVLDKQTRSVLALLPVIIQPGDSVLIGIGVNMAVPWPHQCEVRPRSGLANKHDIELSNSPGTIDPDFRGEAGVLLRNRGDKPFTVEKNMRVAQLVFSKVSAPVLQECETLPVTRRGTGGFGSTGLFGDGIGTSEYKNIQNKMDRYYMNMALAAANLSSCVRGVKRIKGEYKRDKNGELVGQTRKFGCIIVKNDNIVAQGYNAQFPGSPKCSEVGCLREELGIQSGTQIEICRAMHAEWWAITNFARTGGANGTEGATMYINSEPCEVCAKIITGLGVEAVVMLSGVHPTNGVKILLDAGIDIRYINME